MLEESLLPRRMKQMHNQKAKIYCTTCGKEFAERVDKCCLQVEDDCYIQRITVVPNQPIKTINLKIEVDNVLKK